MKVNILQFTNETLQELHSKAATVANAAVVEGPFAGPWWEQYLAVVIETAQAEQRVACSKDVAKIRGFYDLLEKDLDEQAKNLYEAEQREAAAKQLVEDLRKELEIANGQIAALTKLRDTGNVAAGVDAPLPPPPANAHPASDPDRETQYDNPVTYTARPNPFLK